MIHSIIACDAQGGIGYRNALPWPYLKGDMNFFTKHTIGHIVIMGYNTFNSIGKPLENRLNIIVLEPGCIVNKLYNNCLFVDKEDVMKIIKVKNGMFSPIKKNIYIIGGANTIHSFINEIDVIYMTRIYETFECDTFVDLNMIDRLFVPLCYGDSLTDSNITYRFEAYVKK